MGWEPLFTRSHIPDFINDWHCIPIRAADRNFLNRKQEQVDACLFADPQNKNSRHTPNLSWNTSRQLDETNPPTAHGYTLASCSETALPVDCARVAASAMRSEPI